MTPQIYDAFRLHDQDGFTLDMSVDAASARGWSVNLAAFACDALGAGWPQDRVRRAILQAKPSVEWGEFRLKLAQLWTASGKLPDPECWPAMKKRIQLAGAFEP